MFRRSGKMFTVTNVLNNYPVKCLVKCSFYNFGDFGFKSYPKLFESCVVPILDYCASVWGYKHYQTIDNVQYRALRYFLGVHRFAPKLAVTADTGWLPVIIDVGYR